jgi:UDP-2,3-diacylglucosamine hydrolase
VQTLFVSDLHLCTTRAAQIDLFVRFTRVLPGRASALYILGDLFEVWLGDDACDEGQTRVVQALAALTRAGVDLFIGHGNRDFLFGARFLRASGAQVLDDYAVIDLFGSRTLLTHGDLLCTRDVKYQRFRRCVRHPIVRSLFLATPLAWRRRIAAHTRSGTLKSMRAKSAAIMDVDESTVTQRMHSYGARLLIHGHTHRPAIHDYAGVDQRRRIVLGDWYEEDSVLVCDTSGQHLLRASEYMHAASA